MAARCAACNKDQRGEHHWLRDAQCLEAPQDRWHSWKWQDDNCWQERGGEEHHKQFPDDTKEHRSQEKERMRTLEYEVRRLEKENAEARDIQRRTECMLISTMWRIEAIEDMMQQQQYGWLQS